MNKTTFNILQRNYKLQYNAILQMETAIKRAKTNRKKLRKLIEKEKKELKGHYNNE